MRRSEAATLATPRKQNAAVALTKAGVVCLLAALAFWAGSVAQRAYVEWRDAPEPAVARVDILPLFIDRTPVQVTVTAAGYKLPHVTTADALLRDPVLWRRMHLDGWNLVPQRLRTQGLDAMLATYRHLLHDPALWDSMEAADWDAVPQPIRTLAFRHMSQYWSGYYDVGLDHGIVPGLMAETLNAIVMSESWFDHRVVNHGSAGNRDIGLAQASDFARRRLSVLFDTGIVDVRLEEVDYFNPWKATRFVAVWMKLLLHDTGGDLELAIRAYHRGVARAMDDRGTVYLEAVKRRRRRFIQNRDSPAAWRYVWIRGRELTREDWPWMQLRPRSSSRLAYPFKIPASG